MAKDKIEKIKTDLVKSPKKKKKEKQPISLAKTEVGDHLTIITDESGKQTFVWDWDKLSTHVNDAIKAHEKKLEAKAKRKAKRDAKNI